MRKQRLREEDIALSLIQTLLKVVCQLAGVKNKTQRDILLFVRSLLYKLPPHACQEQVTAEVFGDSGTETNSDHTNTDTLTGAAVTCTRGRNTVTRAGRASKPTPQLDL